MFTQLPEVVVNLPALGRVKIDASFFKKFNYGNAAVWLISFAFSNLLELQDQRFRVARNVLFFSGVRRYFYEAVPNTCWTLTLFEHSEALLHSLILMPNRQVFVFSSVAFLGCICMSNLRSFTS